MLDAHLLADRQIEFSFYEFFTKMNRKFCVAAHFGQRPRAEAFVADRIALGDTEGEGRVLVEHEIGAVVVVDDDRHVRLQLGEPLAHRHVGVRERLPRRRLHLAAVVGDAHRRHVREAYAGDDLRRHP